VRRSCLLVLSAIVVCWIAPRLSVRAQQDAPKPPGTDEVYILGKDLLQLLQKDPEAVILVGESARKYIESTRAREQTGASVIVQQCEIRGELLQGAAKLHVEITARSDHEGRAPLPVALGEALLLSFSIDGGPPFLTRDGQGWIAWVEGRGRHTVVADVQLPIVGSSSLGSLVCGIPEAPITLLELTSSRPLGDVRLAPAAPVTIRPTDDSKLHLSAALGPRSRLDVRWRWDDQAESDLPTLLRAKSQVTASVEPEGIQLKTELRIHALRGSQQTIELRNSSDERLLDVQTTDGKVIGWQSSSEGGVARILLHYTEPLVGTSELLITSERPWSGNAATVHGWIVQGAYSHWSQMVVRSAPELDVAVSGTENARPTDSLPATLRSPRNVAAFAAFAQPYRLDLSILPRSAHIMVRSSALVSYAEDLTRIAARWQFSVHGGKTSQLDFLLPAHFQAEQFVLSDSVQTVREEETPRGRIAHVFLKGTPDEFDVRLHAAVPLPVARNLVKLELPWPVDAETEWSRLYLAGTSDLDLDPTPNYVAIDSVPDDSLVREVAGRTLSIRAFECRSSLDQVAIRLSKSTSIVWHQAHAQLQFEEDSVVVQQSFEFGAAGVAPRQLRFVVPEAVRGAVQIESAPDGARVDVSDELVIRLPPDYAGSPEVQLRYRWPLAPHPRGADSWGVLVPLVRVANAQCEATDVRVTAPSQIHLRSVGDGWHTVSQRVSNEEDTQWTLRRAGAAESVEFQRGVVSWLPEPSTVIDRGWIETAVNSQGQWRMRARYVVMNPDPSQLRVRIPHGRRLVALRWNGQSVAVRRGADVDTMELLDAIPSELPAVLEIELDGLVPDRSAVWGKLAWDAPVLLGNVVWGKIFWQLDLPDDMAVVRGPRGYSDENETQWSAASVRLVPRQEPATLDRWIGGSRRIHVTDLPGQRLLYSRLLTVGPMEVTYATRWMLVLLSSGAVMFFAMLLVALPRRHKGTLVLVSLIMITIFVSAEPQVATECARSAVWGVLLAVVAGASHVVLLRQRGGKLSVFPEPGVLAKSRGASFSGVGGVPTARGEMLPGAAAQPVPPLAPSSSSVR
jgi:hypothetical protein